jgi:vitamin B12 transporter
LHNVTNLNLQTRGFHGSQSDIGIRNGNYEQVGILLNGIRLNNPTTGHNNVIFPFTRQSIESIDIIKGRSGNFFGNNSLCGNISFNTSKPKKNELIGDISLGSFSNFSLQLGYNFIGKKSWHRFSTNYLRAADYRPNTDNETIQFINENHFEVIKELDIYATVGIHAKKFGANRFYALRFPNQYEEIQSLQTNGFLVFYCTESYQHELFIYCRTSYARYKFSKWAEV